jgi:hypothetical protein
MVRQAMLAPLVAGVVLLLNSGADAFVPQFAAKPRFGYGFGSKMATARQVSQWDDVYGGGDMDRAGVVFVQ